MTELAAFVPGPLPKGMSRCGRRERRSFGSTCCLDGGAHAGAAAATATGFTVAGAAGPVRTKGNLRPRSALAGRGCQAQGVRRLSRTTSPSSDIALAEREGYRSIEHVKRYTTLGMATDQGKTANVNGLAILAGADRQERSRKPASRQRVRPIRRSRWAHSRATIAARTSRPTRLPPSYEWAKEPRRRDGRDRACGCARNTSRVATRSIGSRR